MNRKSYSEQLEDRATIVRALHINCHEAMQCMVVGNLNRDENGVPVFDVTMPDGYVYRIKAHLQEQPF